MPWRPVTSAVSKPSVKPAGLDFGEYRARFVAAIGVAEQSRERLACAQFPPFRALLLSDCDRFAENRYLGGNGGLHRGPSASARAR